MKNFATFWPRIAAFLIDSMLIGLAGSIFVKSFSLQSLVQILVYGAIGWLYSTFFFTSKWQATIGYKLNRLKLADDKGNSVGFIRASVRFIFSLFSSIVPLLHLTFFFTARKQAWHDLLAKTVVHSEYDSSLYSGKWGGLESRRSLMSTKSSKYFVLIWIAVSVVFAGIVLYFMWILAYGMGFTSNAFEIAGAMRTGAIGYKPCRTIPLNDADAGSYISSMTYSNDGDLYITGHTQKANRIWIARLNAEGKPYWIKDVGEEDSGGINTYIAYCNGNVFVARKRDGREEIVSAFDRLGQKLWEKKIDYGFASINSLVCNETSFSALGWTFDAQSNLMDMDFIVFGRSGQIELRRQYGGSSRESLDLWI